MRTSLKKLWVEELRSGRYTQTTQTLKGVVPSYERPDPAPIGLSVGFCCLGVLCKVLEQHPEERPRGFRMEEEESQLGVAWVDDEGGFNEYGHNELPTRLLDHLGLDEYVGHLMNMNDGGGGVPRQSFSEIAAYIEENVK